MHRVTTRTLSLATAVLLACLHPGTGWAADTVEVYAAGSLRGVVSDLAQRSTATLATEVKPTFGGSGSLRERIEGGEKPDLFLSADLGSPQKLEAQGRTVVPVIAFARNRMCVVSRRSTGLTSANLIARLLKPALKVRTSTPVADPSGDYAWAIFDRIDARHPGAGDILKAKAQSLMHVTAPAATGQSQAAALFTARAIDVSITYCSGAAGLLKEVPELESLPVPPALDPHPVYGLAVLSAKPDAWRVALLLLSQQGQAIIASNGLLPLLDAAGSTP